MRMTSRTLLIACLAVALWGQAALAQTKLAVVNSREILTKCKAGAKIVADLQTQFASRRQELADLERKVRQQQGEAQASRATAAAKKDFQASLQKWRETRMKLQQDVAREEKERFKPILERINAVLVDYAKEKGLDGIQDRTTYLFVSTSLDVTGEIIKRLDKGM